MRLRGAPLCLTPLSLTLFCLAPLRISLPSITSLG